MLATRAEMSHLDWGRRLKRAEAESLAGKGKSLADYKRVRKT